MLCPPHLVGMAMLEFRHEFHEEYFAGRSKEYTVLPGVGPMESFIGFCIQKGYLVANAEVDFYEKNGLQKSKGRIIDTLKKLANR